MFGQKRVAKPWQCFPEHAVPNHADMFWTLWLAHIPAGWSVDFDTCRRRLHNSIFTTIYFLLIDLFLSSFFQYPCVALDLNLTILTTVVTTRPVRIRFARAHGLGKVLWRTGPAQFCGVDIFLNCNCFLISNKNYIVGHFSNFGHI